MGNDDAGAGGREADFGEGEGEDDVLVPDWLNVIEDDVGEGSAVGVVDDEGDVVVFGKRGELVDLGISEDVASGIGGTGDADGGGVGGDLEVVEVDVVFEGVVIEVFEGGLV